MMIFLVFSPPLLVPSSNISSSSNSSVLGSRTNRWPGGQQGAVRARNSEPPWWLWNIYPWTCSLKSTANSLTIASQQPHSSLTAASQQPHSSLTTASKLPHNSLTDGLFQEVSGENRVYINITKCTWGFPWTISPVMKYQTASIVWCILSYHIRKNISVCK